MQSLTSFFEKIVSKIFGYYIQVVYKTSRIIKIDTDDALNTDNNEKFIIVFWHGDSYCFYPFLKGEKLYVITTEDRRGDYISSMCEYFGYMPIRVPDKSVGGNFLFKIRKKVNGKNKGNLAIALDGPLGPYHEPKSFPFVTALLTKRRILPVSITNKRKIQMKKRWDKYTIPLIFNRMEIHVHKPLEVTKKDFKSEFSLVKEEVRRIMEA